MDHNTALIIAHLDNYRAHHPTELLAINAAACAHVEGASAMSHDARWTQLVKPVQLELATRQLRAHTAARKPVRASLATQAVPTASASPTKPALDVRGFAGANRTLKLMSYIRSQPGGATLSHQSAHQKANELASSCQVLA